MHMSGFDSIKSSCHI